jgi:hypothetical protein
MLRALKRRRLCTGLDGAAMSINNTVGAKQQQQREKETKQKSSSLWTQGRNVVHLFAVCCASFEPKVGEKERNRERER